MLPKPFKPPRPIQSSAAGLDRTAAASKPSQPSFMQDLLSSPQSDNDDNNKAVAQNTTRPNAHGAQEVLDSDDDEINNIDNTVAITATTTTQSQQHQGPAPIPPNLLSRILHDSFQHDETKLSKEAFSVLQKYMDMFAREAMFRAIAERVERANNNSKGKGKSAGGLFLEVEDLERLTPQLLVDFCFV